MARDRAGTWLRLSVRVAGYGMDERRLAETFTPLFSTETDSIGVGLTVVRSIIEESGGWIEVSSEGGLGTSIDAYFPVVEYPSENVISFTEAALSRGNQ